MNNLVQFLHVCIQNTWNFVCKIVSFTVLKAILSGGFLNFYHPNNEIKQEYDFPIETKDNSNVNIDNTEKPNYFLITLPYIQSFENF